MNIANIKQQFSEIINGNIPSLGDLSAKFLHERMEEAMSELKKFIDAQNNLLCKGRTLKDKQCSYKPKENGFCGVHNKSKERNKCISLPFLYFVLLQ